MTPSETDTDQAKRAEPIADGPAAPQVPAPEEAAEAGVPDAPATEPVAAPEQAEEAAEAGVPDAPATEPVAASEQAEEAAAAPVADAPVAPTDTPPAAEAAPADTPLDAGITAEGATAEAPVDGSVPAPAADGSEPKPRAQRPARPPRRNRQADRRKQLEEQSRTMASELGREPDRKVVEKAILSAGGPDAVREFLATPQESREGKPLGWRIACLREARRHDSGGRAEEGWVTLSAVPVRAIRNALDRAVDADGRIMFRDEPVDGRRGGGRGGPRRGGDRRPGGRDERAVADQFMEGGVASFGGEGTGKRNPFSALSGLLEDDEKK